MYQYITIKSFSLSLRQEVELLKFTIISIAAADFLPFCLALSFERLHSGVADNGGRV